MMFVHTILLKDCQDSHDCMKIEVIEVIEVLLMNFGPKQRDRVCLCLARRRVFHRRQLPTLSDNLLTQLEGRHPESF